MTKDKERERKRNKRSFFTFALSSLNGHNVSLSPMLRDLFLVETTTTTTTVTTIAEATAATARAAETSTDKNCFKHQITDGG